MARLLTILVVLVAVVALSSSAGPKGKQYNGKKVFADVFKHCKVPRSERKIIRQLDLPSSQYAACFAAGILKTLSLIKPDGTTDTEKFSQQFIDYGLPVPDAVNGLSGVHIEREPELFAERIWSLVGENKVALKTVFWGSPKEDFSSDGVTFDN